LWEIAEETWLSFRADPEYKDYTSGQDDSERRVL